MSFPANRAVTGCREAVSLRIVASATATPPYVVGPDDIRRDMRQVFGSSFPHFARIDWMVDQTAIETRYPTLPPYELVARRDLEDSDAMYLETARDLGAQCASFGARCARLGVVRPGSAVRS